MNKKHIRTLSTLLLAVIMVFTMGISAFAASGDGTNLGTDNSINPDKEGVVSNGGVRENGEDSSDKNPSTHGVFNAVGNTITLDKEIVIFNTRSSETVVYLPNIKYEYEVTAVDVANDTGSEKYITDEYGNKGAINDGVVAAINNNGTPFVEFSNTAGISGTGMTTVATPYVKTTKEGVAAEGHFNLTFNPSAFTKPGVYRYKVSEKVADGYGKAMAGVIDNGTYNADRYLDVYVQNKSDNSGMEIYGYVCFEATKDTEFVANPGTPLTAKTNGFVSEKNDGDDTAYSKTEEGVDIYETSNVRIQKTITGAMADKTHEFPFEAVFKNATITKDPIISYAKYSSGSTEYTADPVDTKVTMTGGEGTVGSAASGGQLKLKDGDFIYVFGIPGKEAASSTGTTTVLTKEFNDTAEVYTVSATYDGSDKNVKSGSEDGASVHMNASATTEFSEAQTILIANEKDDVVVTNKLNAISPTNVVMRYAPYLIILAGGMLILLVGKRRRSEEN